MESTPDWEMYNGVYYFLDDKNMVDYDTATELCASHGAHLAVIETQEEQDFLAGMFQRPLIKWERGQCLSSLDYPFQTSEHKNDQNYFETTVLNFCKL